MEQVLIAIALWCMKPNASAARTMTSQNDQKSCREAFIKCYESDPKKPDILKCAKEINP